MKYRILEQLQSALVKRKLIIFEIFLCNKVTFINRISGGTAKKSNFKIVQIIFICQSLTGENAR